MVGACYIGMWQVGWNSFMSKNVRNGIAGDVDDLLDMTFSEWLASRSPKDRKYYYNRARYAGNDLSKDDRLFLASEAEAFQREVKSLCQWDLEVMSYPREPLTEKRLTKSANPDLPFRALYLMEAIASLLEIVNAPPAMKSDFKTIMGKRLPHDTKKRGDLQEKMIDFPGLSETQLAKQFHYDQTRMRDEIETGKLERHPQLDGDPQT